MEGNLVSYRDDVEVRVYMDVEEGGTGLQSLQLTVTLAAICLLLFPLLF